MRELAAVLMVAAGACYTPSFTDCEVRCASNSTCPSGQECDGEFCRAPNASGACMAVVIDSPLGSEGTPGDSDGDGVADATDNCPMKANPQQDNEDGDQFGNVCDPCPPLGDPIANMDSDGDGVGNGCDPNGNLIGDSIVLFEGFDRMPVQPGFLSVGQVSYAGGQASVFGTQTSPAFVVWQRPDTDRVVSAQITYDTLMGAPALAGVVDRYSPANQGGIACEAGHDVTGLPSLVVSEMPMLEQQRMPISLAPGMARGLAMSRRSSLNECAISTGQRITYSSDTNFGNNDIHAGVRVRGAAIHAHWVMFVNGPNMP